MHQEVILKSLLSQPLLHASALLALEVELYFISAILDLGAVSHLVKLEVPPAVYAII
jgi:hypothetical protein